MDSKRERVNTYNLSYLEMCMEKICLKINKKDYQLPF